MAYQAYLSTFDSIINVAKATDVTDKGATAAAVKTIKTMLKNRPSEETGCVDGASPDLAHLRIDGSHAELVRLVEVATVNDAPGPFVAVIKVAASEAAKAFGVAVGRRNGGGGNGNGGGGAAPAPAPAPQPWTKDPPVNLGPNLDPSDVT